MPEARSFDGTNDNINFGSDASIDDWGAVSVSCWVLVNATTSQIFYSKFSDAPLGWYFRFQSTNQIRISRTYTTTDGTWTTTGATLSTATRYHVGATQAGDTSNATLYYNGSSETPSSTPSGSLESEAALSAISGENSSGSFDLNGLLQNLCATNATWSAADFNRARWWGRPHGGVGIYHPFFTDKLTNEGSATADGTASGTTVAAFVTPVVRPGTAMMGMGVGW